MDSSPDTTPLRVGLVGLSASGGWAASAHVPAIAATEGLTITALATSSEASARAAAEQFGVPHAFGSVADLAACDEVDLVVVAVKVPLHRDLLVQALGAGKAVLCEWPLARQLAEAYELVAAAEETKTFVGLQGRAAPAVRHLRDLVADGYVGRVLSTSLVASGPQWGLPVSDRSAYAVDAEQGATMLAIPFGHTIDCIEMVLGNLTEVAATTATRREAVLNKSSGTQVRLTAEDQVAVTGRIGDGAVLSAHYRGGLSRGTNFLWEINGTVGDLQVFVDSGSLQIGSIVVRGGRGDDRALSELVVPSSYDRFPELAGTASHALAHAYAQIVEDVRTGTSSAPDFTHGLALHRLLTAVQRSSADGARQDVASGRLPAGV